MSSQSDVERLAQAAFWYYVQELSQDAIAQRMGTSRSNVSRLLRSARERGVVRFEISYPVRRDLDLEHRLLDRYAVDGLRAVTVAVASVSGSTEGEDAAGRLAVARAGADWLRDNLRDDQTLGLFWGGTIKAVVDVAHFDTQVRAHVLQWRASGATILASPVMTSCATSRPSWVAPTPI